MDKYRKSETFLVVERLTKEPLRWESDNKLCYYSNIEDALQGLPKEEFVAAPVDTVSMDIQKEYENLIDENLDN